MITSTLILFLTIHPLQVGGQGSLFLAQVRPGSFKPGDPATAANYDKLVADRRLAGELLDQRDPAAALRVLNPWRGKLSEEFGRTLIDYFFQSHVMLGDWQSALQIAREEYDQFANSRSTSPTHKDVLRLATAMYVVGQKEQAWQLCQREADVFNASFYENYLKEFRGAPVPRAELGNALLRASARSESYAIRPYFYALLIKERPNEAELYHQLARSLPDDDLLSKKIHMERAVALAEGETKKNYKRYLDDINWQIKVRENQSNGKQGISVSIGG